MRAQPVAPPEFGAVAAHAGGKPPGPASTTVCVMKPAFVMKFRMLPVAATAMLALTACTGGGGGSAAPGPTGGAVPKALVDAAKCMRDNGFPEWPDPVRLEDGHWGFPDSAPQVAAPPACAELFRAAKSAQRPSRAAPDLAKLRQWAACVRAHGVVDWPDPGSDGLFDPPARLKPIEDSPELNAATGPCESLEPPGGIGFVPGNGPSKPPR
jgi:hypothetical protein